MAVKKIYTGSFGPFLYDDADTIDDVDGDFEDETQQAFRSDGGAKFDGDFFIGGDLDVTGTIESDEIRLVPKSSSTGAEGTMFYDSDDDHVYVATE